MKRILNIADKCLNLKEKMIIKCKNCGWEFDGNIGDLTLGIEAGVTWIELPDTFHCPKCKNKKNNTSRWEEIDQKVEVKALIAQTKDYYDWKENISKKYTLTGRLAVLNEAREQLIEYKKWIKENLLEEKPGANPDYWKIFYGGLIEAGPEFEKTIKGKASATLEQIEKDILQIEKDILQIEIERKMLKDGKTPQIGDKSLPSNKPIRDLKIAELDENLIREYLKYLKGVNKLNEFRGDIKGLQITFLHNEDDYLIKFSKKYQFDVEFLRREINNYVGKTMKTNLRLYNLLEHIICQIEKE